MELADTAVNEERGLQPHCRPLQYRFESGRALHFMRRKKSVDTVSDSRYPPFTVTTVPCKFCDGTGTGIDHVSTGKGLRRLREARRASLRSIAALLGYSYPYLSDLELGKRNWTPAKIAAYKNAIGLSNS